MWYKTIEQILKQLDTNENGLKNKEADRRLKEEGKNKIPTAKKRTIIDIIIEQFKSPIIIILVFAAIFSFITNSTADAIFIIAVIGINTIIGTYQEWSSKKSAEKLQEMIKINAKVIRDDKREMIDSEEIVVGDIVEIESGDKIPADIRLINSKNLCIDESVLTGESKPRNKNTIELKKDTELAERTNIAFAGSVVAKGRGKGVVIATGKNTEFGKIAEKVLLSEDEKTPLVIKIEKFSKQISIGFIALAVIIAVILFVKGYAIDEVFSSVIALTVSAIPEGLTIAMTIVLSISSNIMAQKNVIVKKLSAVESLGSCNVIATDKTGTLTVNEQTAKKIVLPDGSQAYIKGIGYNDIGEIRYEENIKNNVEEIIKMGYINNEATLKFEEGKWKYSGDAIDTAFLALGMKIPIKNIPQIKQRIHYESYLKYSAVMYEENENEIITLKGAPEKIVTFCKYMKIDKENKDINVEKILKQNAELASEGYRVIAIAKCKKNKFKNHYYKELNEKDFKNFIFLGLVAFVDPIREGVEEAVKTCKKAGIETIMITGDQKETAEAIAKRIGIEKVYSRVTPIEKLEIVNKLKNDGKLVAVTGDGVNDSPALKSANIGVAMGSGTDIAKETGNMIITDDNFSSIVKAVEEGRHAYNNIRKVLYLLLSTGLSEVILFIFSVIFNLPIPLIAIQLLWLNLISNGVQSSALAYEKDIEDVMKNKNSNNNIFDKLMIEEILISAMIMAFIEIILYIYMYRIKKFDIITTRTYLLTFMVFIENMHIFNCRSEKISIFKIPINNNIFLVSSIFITSIIQIIIVRNTSIAKILDLTVISIEKILLLFLLTIPLIIIMEVFKKKRLKTAKKHDKIRIIKIDI